MAYASWSVVFGEQPSAAKWNILGTNDSYFDSLIGSGTAWTSWTPTLSGRLNDSKWTKAAAYQQFGKFVFFRIKLTASTTTPMDGGTADARFSLPVTATSYAPSENYLAIGSGGLYDNGTAVYPAAPIVLTSAPTTTGAFRYVNSTSWSALTSTAPFTWTTSDEIAGTGFYQAA